jgi:hypothetical protein
MPATPAPANRGAGFTPRLPHRRARWGIVKFTHPDANGGHSSRRGSLALPLRSPCRARDFPSGLESLHHLSAVGMGREVLASGAEMRAIGP